MKIFQASNILFSFRTELINLLTFSIPRLTFLFAISFLGIAHFIPLFGQNVQFKVVSIDSLCVDNYAKIIYDSTNQNWNDSLDSTRNYPTMRLYKNISLGLNNFLILQNTNSYMRDPFEYFIYYFGLITDYNYNANETTCLTGKDKIPIIKEREMLLNDVSLFNINEVYDDNNLISMLVKNFKIQQYIQYTDKKTNILGEYTLHGIHKARKEKFSKFRFTRIQFYNDNQWIVYYKWERMINNSPKTIAIEIRIANA